MRRMRSEKRPFSLGQRGFSLLETLVALAILGAIAVTFLNGVNTAIKTTAVADEHTTAESLAQSQMEWVKRVEYVEEAAAYNPASLPGSSDYQDYSVTVTSEPLFDPDAGLQKITVTVKHNGEAVFTLEGYKRQR
jgi:prepilin-type N-terminal cleavage/methylation domain-containing protein